MSLATLAGVPIARATTQIPAWGLAWADVDLAEAESLPMAMATLDIAGQPFVGTLVSGGVFEGRAAYHWVAGAGGWRNEIKAKAYANDAGVKASTVLADAAREVGETLASPPSTKLGPHFARRKGTASSMLHELAPRGWYVDAAGVTCFGARPTVAYVGDAVRVTRDPRMGLIELATEDISQLLPGVQIDGASAATDVEYSLDAARLTVRVYCAPTPARRLAAWADLLDALDPRRAYRCPYEYRVLSQTGERLNVQPVRVACGMPELARVPVRGPFGLKATVTPGALVLVGFADGDPSRPQVTAGPAWDDPGWMPTAILLGLTPQLGIARQTDPVVAGPFAGTITMGSLTSKAGA